MSLVEVHADRGKVQSSGVELEVSLTLVDGVAVGDYVIVHAGYAIQFMSAQEAEENLAILERLEASWRT